MFAFDENKADNNCDYSLMCFFASLIDIGGMEPLLVVEKFKIGIGYKSLKSKKNL